MFLTVVLYADEKKGKNVYINIADGLFKLQIDRKDVELPQDKNIKISIGGGIFELNVNGKNVKVKEIDDVDINVGKGFGAFIAIVAYIMAMVLVLFNLTFYLLPSIVALIRKINKRDIFIIAILNLLFGWTVIGWIIILIWAFVSQKTVNKVY